jgi:hypothetical protein
VIAIALIVGISGLMTVVGRPRFATYRTVDVLQLVAAGACFGIALAEILRALRDRART